MRFKQFIIEQAQPNETGSESDFTIKGLSDGEWAAWVEQNCGDYLPRAGKYPIYRGFLHEIIPAKLGIKDTNEFTRRSANTFNYFTLWLDNAPQWRDYPRRSKSFVGSSNSDMATIYGQLYQLFPANDAKIGICPERDIWFSFNQIPGDNVNNFLNLLQITFKNTFGNRAAERAETEWSELRFLLKSITPDEFIEVIEDNLKHYDIPEQFTRYPKLIDYFENEIVPWKHGFKHATPATYSVTQAEDKEVWVQGKVALLDVSFIFSDGGHLFPKTMALLSKHNIRKSY